MSGRVLGFLGLAALVAVPVATAQTVLGWTVFRTTEVHSGWTEGLRLTCAPGYLAVSGGVHAPAAGVATLSVHPVGLRGYLFRFRNATGENAQVTAAVACRKLPRLTTKSPFLRLTPVRSKPVSVPPGGQKTVSLKCPAGTLAGGSGYELDSGQLSVRRQTQTLQAFSMTIRNLGTTVGSTRLYGGCLTLVRPPGAAKQRLRVSVLTSTTPIRPGVQVLMQRCPKGWFSLSTGYSLPAGLRVGGSAATAAGGKWTLTSAAAAQTLADLQLVCGRIAPS